MRMKKYILAAAALVLLTAAPARAEEFSSPGTRAWTVPGGAAKIRVEAWGGGGAGGRGVKTSNHHVSGFGGGAGGYASKEISVTPGDVYQVTVGSGGKSPGAGGSNSEFSKGGQVVVGAGGGGGGMSGSTNGQSASGAGAGAGGTNVSYVQKSKLISDYDNDNSSGNIRQLLNYERDGSLFAIAARYLYSAFAPAIALAQTDEALAPAFDAFYSGVAGQGGKGYAGDVTQKGADGGGYSSVGGNPYASSGGGAPMGGAGGSRGRLGRDGIGCCVSSDTWAMDGSVPGGAGGGSDTGVGGFGADGRVVVTVIENQPVSTNPGSQPDQPGPSTAVAHEPEGWVDGSSCTALSGWAYDQDTPEDQLSVRLYEGPKESGRQLAALATDRYRPDVNQSKGISGNHGFAYAIPSSLKDGVIHMVYAYAADSGGTGREVALAGSPKPVDCLSDISQTTTRTINDPVVGITASPASLSAPGTVSLAWLSTGASECRVSWSAGSKAPLGSEVSPLISSATTFSVTCTAPGGGSATDSVTVPVSYAPASSDGVDPAAQAGSTNAVSWVRIDAPASVRPGQTIVFSAVVKNTGTKTWGTNYRFVMKGSDHRGLQEVPPPYSVTPGQSATVNFVATAPASAALSVAYRQAASALLAQASGVSFDQTYYFQALEPGIEWFGPEPSKTLQVSASAVQDPPVSVTPPTQGGTAGSGSGSGSAQCSISKGSDGPLSLSLSGGTATIRWDYPGGSCAAANPSWMGSQSNTSQGSVTVSVSRTTTWSAVCAGGGFPPAFSKPSVSVSCPSGSQSAPVPVPDFTVSATSPIKMQAIGGVGGTTNPSTISIGAANGFSSPVAVTVVLPAEFAGLEAEYSWNGGGFDAVSTRTIQPTSNGYPPTTLSIRLSGGTVPAGSHIVTIRAVGGTVPARTTSFAIDANSVDLQYREQ